MRPLFWILCILAIDLDAPRARAESWQTTDQPPIEGQLSGVYGAVAFIERAGSASLLTLDKVDDAGLARIADFLDASGKAPRAAWADSGGKIAKSLGHRLEVLKDGKLVAFDPGTRPEPALYVAYFGAHWCPPCRAFSPKLVEAYRRLQELAPGRFEVVFVSADRSYDDQVFYARDIGMPWPILKYSEIGSVPAVERLAGPGIPDLVVFTRDGAPLYDSYHGAEYVGPESVLDHLEPLLMAMDEKSPFSRRARHRLAVLQYVRGAAGGSKGPSPYMIELDPSHYQTLEIKKLSALLDIDEKGHVTGAEVEPKLSTSLEFLFEQDAQNWLFLPAVERGRAKAVHVRLPVNF